MGATPVFVLMHHHGFPTKAPGVCILCMIKQVIKKRGDVLSVRHFKNDRLYSSCFLLEHINL